MKILDQRLLEAVDHLRSSKSIPNLSIRYPGESLPNGDYSVLCYDYDDTPNHTHGLSFKVNIPSSDLDKSIQQIDLDAHGRTNISYEHLVLLRVAYRIHLAYKTARKKP